MNSVFRLAARRTGVRGLPLNPEAAPVSEKRVGLNRSPGPRAMGVESHRQRRQRREREACGLSGPGGRACCGLAG